MTHTGPMSDDEGTFGDAKLTQRKCRKCGEQKVYVESWDSDDGAFEDEKYTCRACGYYWWVEGPDA